MHSVQFPGSRATGKQVLEKRELHFCTCGTRGVAFETPGPALTAEADESQPGYVELLCIRCERPVPGHRWQVTTRTASKGRVQSVPCRGDTATRIRWRRDLESERG